MFDLLFSNLLHTNPLRYFNFNSWKILNELAKVGKLKVLTLQKS